MCHDHHFTTKLLRGSNPWHIPGKFILNPGFPNYLINEGVKGLFVKFLESCVAATMQHLERELPVGAAVLAAGLHRMRPPAVPDVCRCGTAEVDLQFPLLVSLFIIA